MIIINDTIYRGLRKAFRLLVNTNTPMLPSEKDPDKSSEIIYNHLSGKDPCMIARFGSGELQVVTNWRSINKKHHNIFKYIKGEEFQWWWNDDFLKGLYRNAGFFSLDMENVNRFCEMMIQDMQLVDVLGSWRWEECFFINELKHAQKVWLTCLEPFLSDNPWSRVLKGKHVLVIHPFAEDIISQYYRNREKLFANKLVLPEFASLHVIKAVQSIDGDSNGFGNWFDALDWMKQQMDKRAYDIALIGCGAYGFPLAAYAKRTGHKAVHLGGALQLLFGIKGRRWENPNLKINYNKFFNDFWIRPGRQSTPDKAINIENGCYW